MAKGDGLKMENRPSTPLPPRGAECLLRPEPWEHVQELARQGLSISAIELETGFNWKTNKSYVGGPPPAPATRAPAKPALLDPFRAAPHPLHPEHRHGPGDDRPRPRAARGGGDGASRGG